MSFLSDIRWIKIWVLTKLSKSKWLNARKIHLVQWPNNILIKDDKKATRVLAIFMFYETRQKKQKIFKVLSCVIYTIISNYVCIDYLVSEIFFKWTTSWFRWELQTSKQKLWQHIGNWNSISVNEFDVLSWFFEEQGFFCHIKLS